MRALRSPTWKYRDLVAALGDDRHVAALIRQAGFEPPPIKTIAGWRVRNSVPSAWAPLLIEIALRRKALKSIAQLRKAA